MILIFKKLLLLCFQWQLFDRVYIVRPYLIHKNSVFITVSETAEQLIQNMFNLTMQP